MARMTHWYQSIGALTFDDAVFHVKHQPPRETRGVSASEGRDATLATRVASRASGEEGASRC